MKRGEVWWADLPPPAGRRPVVLLSRDEAYLVRSLVTIAPVTTRIRRIASEVELGPSDGLPRRCVANLDTITTVPVASVSERIAVLTPARLRDIEAAIHFVFALSR